MDLRSSKNPAVLDAIMKVVKSSDEKVVSEQQKQAEKTASKYTNFKPKNIQESLVGKQKNIDKNKNGKVDAQDFKLLKKEEKNTDTPGQSHQCALHVKHSKLGEGKTIFSQHAEPDAQGQIAWYDVMFAEGIHKQVPINELEVLVSESHGNHKKK